RIPQIRARRRAQRKHLPLQLHPRQHRLRRQPPPRRTPLLRCRRVTYAIQERSAAPLFRSQQSETGEARCRRKGVGGIEQGLEASRAGIKIERQEEPLGAVAGTLPPRPRVFHREAQETACVPGKFDIGRRRKTYKVLSSYLLKTNRLQLHA